MPVRSLNGVDLAYDEEGEGRPLLLVHAGIVDRRMWDDTWASFSAGYRAIRPDLRGFGATPMPDGSFAHWRDLAALLRELEAAPAHLVGVSMGATASLALALDQPELVDRLVLVAPGFSGWDWSPELRAAWDEEEAAWDRGDLDEVAWINVRTWLDGPMRPADAVDPALRRRVYEMQRHALDLDNDDAKEEAPDPPLLQRLSEVTVPTLVVVGELDQPDMLATARHAAAEIPGARLEVMPGVAHLPPMEAPDAFVHVITAFLEG